ncbi:MAG: cob(I)yrinic acid a,c-diamide adenosyltransferase [Candidatus Saccharibacteria bacterium]
MFEDFRTKDSVVLVYTGEGKGKTTASLGLMARALGAGWHVAYLQFIKHWQVNEDRFIKQIAPIYGNHLFFYKGGNGFYKAGDLSAKNVTEKQHKNVAQVTLHKALEASSNGKYDLVICDEINNALHAGLITKKQMTALIKDRNPKTSLCLTGRDFPPSLLKSIDIASNITKIKHHFDDKFIANNGIDY